MISLNYNTYRLYYKLSKQNVFINSTCWRYTLEINNSLKKKVGVITAMKEKNNQVTSCDLAKYSV